MPFIKDVVLACKDGSKGHVFIQEIPIVIYYILLIVFEKPTTVTKTNAEPFLTGWRHNLLLLEKYIIMKEPDIIGDTLENLEVSSHPGLGSREYFVFWCFYGLDCVSPKFMC